MVSSENIQPKDLYISATKENGIAQVIGQPTTEYINTYDKKLL
jgi:hypothetical protein